MSYFTDMTIGLFLSVSERASPELKEGVRWEKTKERVSLCYDKEVSTSDLRNLERRKG